MLQNHAKPPWAPVPDDSGLGRTGDWGSNIRDEGAEPERVVLEGKKTSVYEGNKHVKALICYQGKPKT